jgi:hypothetical protein
LVLEKVPGLLIKKREERREEDGEESERRGRQGFSPHHS